MCLGLMRVVGAPARSTRRADRAIEDTAPEREMRELTARPQTNISLCPVFRSP